MENKIIVSTEGKELILWTLIILIAWFVYNGGVYDVIDFFQDRVGEFKAETYNKQLQSNNVIDLQISCDLARKGARVWEVSFASVVENDCKPRCIKLNSTYEDYYCKDDSLHCVCS